jgi:phosphoglycerate-specific signal transduction histidine kinase
VPTPPGSPLGNDPLSAVLHELTEPLTALAAYAAAARRLLEDDAGGDLLVEVLDEISAQARRASEIVFRMRQLLPGDSSNSADRSAPGA